MKGQAMAALPVPLWAVLLSVVLLVAMLCLSALPWLASLAGGHWPALLSPTALHPNAVMLPPLAHTAYPLGTDDLGRSLLPRLAQGGQLSLLVGGVTAVLSVAMGLAIGLISGYKGGWLDTVLMRGIDVLYSLPGLVVVMLTLVVLQALLEAGLAHPVGATALAGLALPGVLPLVAMVLALALFSWPDTARLVRSQTLSLMKEPYIEAALSLGMGARRLLFKHLLPNVLALVVLSALITLPRAILTEATLSFLGLGMAPPLSSWGTLASEGWTLLPVAGYVLWLPAGLMVTTLIALNTLGEALKQRLLR